MPRRLDQREASKSGPTLPTGIVATAAHTAVSIILGLASCGPDAAFDVLDVRVADEVDTSIDDASGDGADDSGDTPSDSADGADSTPAVPDAGDADRIDSAADDADGDTAEEPTPDTGPPDAAADPCDGTLTPRASLDSGELRVGCGDAVVSLAALPDGTLRWVERGVGDAAPLTSFAVLDMPEPLSARAGGEGGDVWFCSDVWRVSVNAACDVEASLADSTPVWSLRRATTVAGRAAELRVAPNDRFYGFGEHTGPLERSGTQTTYWNTDAYDSRYGGYAPDADPMYLSVPFGMRVRGGLAAGVFVDAPRWLSIDVASARPDALTITSRSDAPLVVYAMAGPRPADVLRQYTALTGRIERPPRWALGYQQSRWGYNTADVVEEVADGFRRRDIGADVMTLDIQHHDGFRSFTFDPVRFADPNGLIGRLLARGFRTVVIADPGIKVDDAWPVYASGFDAGRPGSGVYIEQAPGEPFVGTVWPGASVFPDFARADARRWWAAHVARVAERGVAGIWLDVNEPTTFPEGGAGLSIPNELEVGEDDARFAMGELHNVYALLQASATVEGLRAARPDERPFVLSRAGYAGIQRVAATWTGDVPSTWWGLQGTLAMVLNLGLSGVPFVGSDVGGYSGNASPELFARWIQLGAFTPFFRGHVTNGVPGQEPWMFGTETEDISRAVIARRYALMPYLYALMVEASRNGSPPLRPLFYEFPADDRAHAAGDVVMFGPSLLVAPVLEENATSRTVWLPAGDWVEWQSGRLVHGPVEATVAVTRAAVPMFLRAGAVVPHVDPVEHTGQPSARTLRLEVTEPGPDGTAFVLPVDDGLTGGWRHGDEAVVRYDVARDAAAPTGDGALVVRSTRTGRYVPPWDRVELRVRPFSAAPASVRLDGVALGAADGVGTGWRFDANDQSVRVVVDERVAWELRIDGQATTDTAATVALRVEVTVPAGTPTTERVHIAGDFNGWVHVPLAWVEPGRRAAGTIEAPRGQLIFYKYTRGDWDTVEKWPACEEATNRYGFAAAEPVRVDEVFGWRDWCPD